MPGIEFIRSFLQQASAQGSRSTALNPLGWALTIALSALLVAVVEHAQAYITGILATFAGIILLTYLAAYIYFMIKDPDALRSEKFTLSKLAIERSITGDNIAGFFEPDEQSFMLPAVEPKPKSDE